ncbi:glycosyltransferase family 2 protein, partial [Candidatus Daviesbacteria bacterium]|nr:glycosyltransferase family 2 protein [Candidatus Daviesbacteria bacterium]
MKTTGLSVFFPCINEEGNVETTVKRAVEVLEKLKLKYEIIVVNDGSSDKTSEVAHRLSHKNPNVRVIDHPKNLGYGEALKSGFYNARFDTIVYTDGDGQFDFSEVTKFLESIKENDVVIGYRIKRQDSFIRRLFGKGWKLTLLTFFRVTLKDVDCGFKMVKREVLEKIPHLESSRGAMINAELVIKGKKAGFKIGQVGVTHYPRISGKPTGANIKVIIKSYLDLIRLWWKLKTNKALFLAILAVLLLATILRFYKISQYMTFLGDEGRDALVIKDLLV